VVNPSRFPEFQIPNAGSAIVFAPMTQGYYPFWGMETIIFKAPAGTKKKLEELAARTNSTISELLRTETAKLVARRASSSAYEKSSHLCGVVKDLPADASTSRDYLKQYAKGAR
jgi:hypothetical protein